MFLFCVFCSGHACLNRRLHGASWDNLPRKWCLMSRRTCLWGVVACSLLSWALNSLGETLGKREINIGEAFVKNDFCNRCDYRYRYFFPSISSFFLSFILFFFLSIALSLHVYETFCSFFPFSFFPFAFPFPSPRVRLAIAYSRWRLDSTTLFSLVLRSTLLLFSCLLFSFDLLTHGLL